MGMLPQYKNPPPPPKPKLKIFNKFGVPLIRDFRSETFESQTMGDVLDESGKDFEFTAWQEWRSKWSTKLKIKLAKFVKWVLEN